MKIVVAGAPNAGKTTVFNFLTGERAKTGNFPGVTVELREGVLPSGGVLTDLPGLYALRPYTPEERISADLLKEKDYDLILHVVAAPLLRRSLLLTLSLLGLSKPMVIYLAQTDRCAKVDAARLEELTGVPVTADRKALPPLLAAGGRVGKVPMLPADPEENLAARHALAKEYASQLVKDPPAGRKKRDADRLFLFSPFARALLLMLFGAVFFLSFYCGLGIFAEWLREGLSLLFSLISVPLTALGLSPFWLALLGGIWTGCSAVISFLPGFFLLFFLLALLEKWGYLARGVVLSDSFMRLFALSGKSMAPLVLGLGCTVPGILATRILYGRDKEKTLFLLPFFPCSAKLGSFSAIAFSLFGRKGILVLLFLYGAGLLVSLICGRLFPPSRAPFLMELPEFHRPRAGELFREATDKIASFLKKIVSVIFFSSLLMTLLTLLTPALGIAPSPQESILARLAGSLSFLFLPLGFGSWQSTAALFAGIFAKENIISTLAALGGDPGMGKAAALSFLIFILLSSPCLTASSALASELGSRKKALCFFLLRLILAWGGACLVFFLARQFLF